MSVQEQLSTIRASLATAERAVQSLQSSCGDSLGLRRLASDVRRLQEDLLELGPLQQRGGSAVATQPAPAREQVGEFSTVTHGLDDCDDEGLGGWHGSRTAP